jgi:hypothetical protein
VVLGDDDVELVDESLELSLEPSLLEVEAVDFSDRSFDDDFEDDFASVE